jgi:hypothetical protein
MTKIKLPLFAITLLSAALAGTGLQAADKKADKAKPTAEASPAAAASSEKKKDSVPFHGKIASADASAKTVTLEGKDAQRVLMITDTTKLKKGDGAATWDDLKAGEDVGGSYKKTADGKMEALSLRVGPKPEKKAKKDSAAAMPADEKKK